MHEWGVEAGNGQCQELFYWYLVVKFSSVNYSPNALCIAKAGCQVSLFQ